MGMKAPFSAYLNGLRGGLKELIALLRQDYDYVSVLATDSKGLAVRISQRARSVSSETMTTERGVVVRVCRAIRRRCSRTSPGSSSWRRRRSSCPRPPI